MQFQNAFNFLVFFLLFPLLSSMRIEPVAVGEASFIIDHKSELYLKGSSNVNNFTCDCLCYDSDQQRWVRFEELSGQVIRFYDTALKLRTSALDCGHKGINKDLNKTMKSEEHPFITIELERSKPKVSRTASLSWEHEVGLKAHTAITIAGVTREVEMDVRGKKIAPNEYRFISEKDLHMSDFNLEPPSPLFGLIKVDDIITIHIDLVVRTVTAS